MCLFVVSIFFVLGLLCGSTCTGLDCKTTENEVNCTAYFYKNNYCNLTVLKASHGGLYEQKLFPGRPTDLVLTPIQEVFPNNDKKGYYPGFLVSIKPPRTADFRFVKGFQLNFHDIPYNTEKRCVVVIFDNGTLKTSNISVTFKIYPLPQMQQNYNFTSFGLPTPLSKDDQELQIRYGTTTEQWVEGSSSTSRWRTTISYYPNEEMKFIKFWFVKAPDSMNITSYIVTISRVIDNEQTSEEKRELLESLTINKTEYKFLNLNPGRYRVGVQSFDDKAGLPDLCKCKNKNGACSSCLKTVTGIVVMPDDGTSTSTATVTLFVPRPDSPTSGTYNDTIKQPYKKDTSSEHVLPSVLGVLSFFLICFVVIGCYKFNKERIHGMFDKRPKEPQNNFKTNLAFTANEGGIFHKDSVKPTLPETRKSPKKKVAIVSTEENDKHRKVVTSFASFLQTHCQCDIEYFHWALGKDKFRWIAQTIDQADFHIFVASESALNQYISWKRNTLPFHTDLFIPYLSKLLNRFDTKVNYAFIRFEYAREVLMPDELTNYQFMLMDDLTPLLACIHELNHHKDNLKEKGLPSVYDVSKTSAGRNLIADINYAAKDYKSLQSRMDSGYTSRTEFSSIDDKEWRDQQKYIINEIVKPPSDSPVNIQGRFLLDEDSKSLMPGRTSRVTESVSIAPAITIAEGGDDWHKRPPVDTQIVQHRPLPNQIGSYLQGVNQIGSYLQGVNQNHNNQDISDLKHVYDSQSRRDDSFFTPPLSDGNDSDEDISTQYQLQMIDNINRAYLKQKDSDSDDAVSGYSV